MFAWLFLVLILSAGFGDARIPTPGSLELGQGVTVTPADGWTTAETVWDVGPNGVSLKSSGVLVAFAADSYAGTAPGLLEAQLADVRAQFGSFRSLPAGEATLTNGASALRVLFSGTADSSDLEGELVVVATGRTGVVMLAVAPTGQIARVQGDLDQMFGSLSIPR